MERPDYVERFIDEILDVCKARGLVLDGPLHVAIATDEALTRLKHATCDPTVPAKRCEHYDETERESYCWRPAAKLVDGSPRCTLHTPRITALQ